MPTRIDVRKIKLTMLVSFMVLTVGQLVFAQETDKDKLIQQAQAGILSKLTPEQIQAKLKELGITEEQARQQAKQRGLRLEDFIQGVSSDSSKGTKIQVAQPGMSPVEVSVPGTTGESSAPEGPPIQFRDTSMPPKGPEGLSYFGYDIFKQVPAAFEPTAVGPVDPGYLTGPGDVLRLTVWGQAEFQYQLEIDREGRIFIPNVGQVFVLGTPLRSLEDKIKNQLSKYYSGLATRPATVFMDVTVAKLRPLRIFAMGEVKQPGGYTISSYATVFNALYSVGGPLTRGSLRNIRVLRENKVVATVDLYDYLLRGDQTSDIRLQNNDLVFVPPRGKSVSIRGEVRRPAIYELKKGEALKDLIGYSGGLLSTAYLEKAQIDRVKPFELRTADTDDLILVDINLGEALKKGGSEAELHDEDAVRVLSILSEKKNFASIQGSVWRPGTFELSKIKTVRDLVAAAEGVLPKTYLERAHIIRLNDDRITTRVIPFNLGQVLNGSTQDLALEPRDVLHVYGSEVTEVKSKSVSVYGHVKSPGTYTLHDGMTLTDLVVQAGGYTEDVDLLQAEISRIRPEGLRGDSLAIILHLKLSRDFSFNKTTSGMDGGDGRDVNVGTTPAQFLLQHRDQVLIRPNPDYKIQQNVAVDGDFTYPGVYAVKQRGERISEILARAGGPTTTSYLGGAQYFRGSNRLIVDLEKAYNNKDRDHDIVVQPGDRIVIPSHPRTVLVSGEINRPGLYSFLSGSAVGDYIDRAGGRTDSAHYALLTTPFGETKQVKFGFLRANPTVPEGSSIVVLRKPPEPEGEKIDWTSTIKDTFAIITSGATLAFIVWQITK